MAAITRKKSGYVLVGDVARYLGVDRDEVMRAIKRDGLPVISLPGRTRRVVRVHLRSLHGWLVERGQNVRGELANYDVFRSDFFEAQGWGADE